MLRNRKDSDSLLTWSEMSRFCDDIGLDGEPKLMWIRLLTHLDDTRATLRAKKQKAPPKPIK